MAIIQKQTSVPVLPLGNYNGNFTSSPIEVAADVTSIDFNILCNSAAQPTIWPNVSTVLTITPEISTNAGVTWTECGKSVTQGGPHTNRFGVPLQSLLSGGSLPPQVGNVPRQYRISTSIVNGPLRSSASIEVN